LLLPLKLAALLLLLLLPRAVHVYRQQKQRLL
jgi:hypothetical protein